MPENIKNCNMCSERKELSMFNVRATSSDGKMSTCRDCDNERKREYYKTIPGLVSRIYSHQKANSKARGYNLPTYTKEQLIVWMNDQDDFNGLWSNWINSGCNKRLTPSVDRKDDYSSYTLDNIQLMTWEENKLKSEKDIKSGTNTKSSRAVVGVHIETKESVEFYSVSKASRSLKIDRSDITKCCNNHPRYLRAGNYKWEYKNEKV